jgi:hypothetical protein
MKLAKADFDEQKVAAMSREQMLDAWATVVAEWKVRPPLAAAARVPAVGYAMELERRCLKFEICQYEQEVEAARLREEREEACRKELEWEEARRREERITRK